MAAMAAVFAIGLVPLGNAANDPLRNLQYGLDRIQAEPAWARARGAGVAIAIVDTGVDLQHEDLRGRFTVGYDFVDDDADAQDGNGHGTHVAGVVAAATDNGIGIAGVAPAAQIMPLRVLDADGTGTESDVAAAIRFAVLQARSNGLRLVINLSLTDLSESGVSATSQQIEDAIREAWFAGAVVVAAVGNDDLPFSDYPAAGPNVLAVGATDENDRRASFSNRNPLVVAPGERIVSTYLDVTTPTDHTVYASGSGTSMAAPHVAGVAALLLSDGLDNAQAVERIVRTADDLGTAGRDDDFGFGRVNAARALGVTGVPGVAVAPPGDIAPGDALPFEPLATAAPQAAPPVVAEPPPSSSRGVPIAVAAVLVAVAVVSLRWGLAARAERARQSSTVWEYEPLNRPRE